jgi:hypothetical protein
LKDASGTAAKDTISIGSGDREAERTAWGWRFIDEDRFLLLGMSETAKVCIVCHCYRESDTVIRIISARQATRKEEQRYVRGI